MVSCPINSMVISQSYVAVYQRVDGKSCGDFTMSFMATIFLPGNGVATLKTVLTSWGWFMTLLYSYTHIPVIYNTSHLFMSYTVADTCYTHINHRCSAWLTFSRLEHSILGHSQTRGVLETKYAPQTSAFWIGDARSVMSVNSSQIHVCLQIIIQIRGCIHVYTYI